MRIASGIHRIGDHSIINAYLIEEANEVTLVDVRRQPRAEPARHVLDERCVGEDQAVADGLVFGPLVLAPEALGFVVRHG